MNPYRIVIGNRNAPRLAFECMSVDSFTACAQHADLCDDGERIEVQALSDWHTRNDAQALLRLQQEADMRREWRPS